MNPIRTAILGYGRNGSTMHAGGVAGNPAFQMVAVCDVDPARRDEASKRFGCAVYEDHRKMLSGEALDLVIIVTRSDQHCAMACEAMEAGKHVLVTKPWAVDSNEAGRLVETARRTGKILLPWMPVHWAGDTRRIQELLSRKAIGEVFLIRRTVNCFARRNDWQTQKKFGGGYLLNWGPHVVYPALLVAGGRPKTVYARMQQVINPGDTEDQIFSAITMENGLLVLAEHSITPSPQPNWFIQGSKGTIVAHGNSVKLIQHDPPHPSDPTKYADMKGVKPSEETSEVSHVYGDTDEIYREIAAALQGGAPYAVTPEAALELSVVFDAMRRSSAENQVVAL